MRLQARRAAAFIAAQLFCAAASSGADGVNGEQKAAVCVACHGASGNSANPAIPSLAGQPRQFIATQLIMFREGRRKDPQMSPIAAPLTNAEISALGAYFNSQTAAAPSRELDSAKAAAGAKLTQQYNCVACHAPDLKGQQHIPRLIGQQRDYLRAQLRGFKAGTRFDMDGNMTSAAQPLSDADIELLADYLSAAK